MKKIALASLALILTSCNSTTELPSTPETGGNSTSQIVEVNESRYYLAEDVSVEIPEGQQVSTFPSFDMAFFAEEDLSNYEGDGTFFFNRMEVKKETSLSTEITFTESFYEDVDVTEVELGGRTFTRLFYYSEFGGYMAEDYLLELDGNRLLFASLGHSYDVNERDKNLLELFAMLESLEIGSDMNTTRPADGVTPEDSPNVGAYAIGDYEISMIVPEGMVVSSSAWEERPMLLTIDESDLSEYEGDGLFVFHRIWVREDVNLEQEMKDLEDIYSQTEWMTVEIGGEEYQRLLFFAEFGGYNGVMYMRQIGDDIFFFAPGGTPGTDYANTKEDEEMIKMIESFEVELGL